MSRAALRVLFMHGKLGSPHDNTSQYLMKHFQDVHIPSMQGSTDDFDACLQIQRSSIKSVRPDVVVGESIGGALAYELMASGDWSGPSVLMAPALCKYSKAYNTSSKGVDLTGRAPIIIVHGKKDDIVDINDSRTLANTSNGKIKMYEVDDDHNFHKIIQGEDLKNIILEAVEMSKKSSNV